MRSASELTLGCLEIEPISLINLDRGTWRTFVSAWWRQVTYSWTTRWCCECDSCPATCVLYQSNSNPCHLLQNLFASDYSLPKPTLYHSQATLLVAGTSVQPQVRELIAASLCESGNQEAQTLLGCHVRQVWLCHVLAFVHATVQCTVCINVNSSSFQIHAISGRHNTHVWTWLCQRLL